ncbi:hypothetical protein E2562_034958 [Oryza meyeriana var. granulata]|uniref:Uncharacterized protein n=1 Tax=Oryza meyeriana var. granulata TaxID=110450 RepID=A0A6G1D9B0_9ORYZ|nr:hypothetical protein E2562_034958 [Oryza meyeriana var. granulata]
MIKKAIDKVLAALEEVQVCDIDSGDDDDNETAKKDKGFYEMCCHTDHFFPDIYSVVLDLSF